MRRFTDLRQPPWTIVLLISCALAFAGTAAATQVVVVVPTPGNAIQSGNDLLAAYNGITGASSNNRFLVQLEPGIYDLGDQNLVMQDWVSLAGAGVDATLVRGNGNLATLPTPLDRGLIEGAHSNELRDLTIRVFATPVRPYLVPIYLTDGTPTGPPVDTRISRVRTMAFGSDVYCGGIFGLKTQSVIEDVEVRSACPAQATGIVFQGFSTGAPILRRVDVAANSNGGPSSWGVAVLFALYPRSIRIEDSVVTATGGTTSIGLFVDSGDAEPVSVVDSTISARNGTTVTQAANIGSALFNATTRYVHSRFHAASESGDVIGVGSGGPLQIENSVVSGATNTIVGGFGTTVGASKLEGGPTSGAVTCAGVYDENFAFFPNSCP
jgi:hypothetical protein